MISEQRGAVRLDGEFSSAPKIKAWWGLAFARKASEHEAGAHGSLHHHPFPLSNLRCGDAAATFGRRCCAGDTLQWKSDDEDQI